MRDAILKRRAANHRQQAALVTAQTRHLHAAILSAAGVENAGARSMEIDLVPRPRATKQAKPEAHAPTVDTAILAFGQPEWGYEPDGD